MTKQRKTDAQLTVRLSPEILAHFKRIHDVHSDWAAANSHPSFASLEDFLSNVLEAYPILCQKHEEALDAIERMAAPKGERLN